MLEIVCGVCGFDIVGVDFVEVFLLYDLFGMMVLFGVNFVFELLCVLLGVEYCV